MDDTISIRIEANSVLTDGQNKKVTTLIKEGWILVRIIPPSDDTNDSLNYQLLLGKVCE